MKITSNFKDYYDGIQAYGIDNTMSYKRFKQLRVLENKLVNKVFNYYPKIDDYKWANGRKIYQGTRFYVHIVTNTLFFCGKMIPYLEFIEYLVDESHPRIEREIIVKKSNSFSINSAKKMLLLLEDAGYTFDESGNHGEFRADGYDQILIDFQKMISIYSERKFHECFQSVSSPLFHFTSLESKAARKILAQNKVDVKKFKLIKKDTLVITNPNLKQLGFHKFMDPFSCYQKIAQYISGIIGNTEHALEPLIDSLQIHRHGFDKKYGFRTRPKE